MRVWALGLPLLALVSLGTGMVISAWRMVRGRSYSPIETLFLVVLVLGVGIVWLYALLVLLAMLFLKYA